MADFNINAVKRRVVLSGSAGTGPYAFTFEILDQNDIAVYKDTTLLTLTTDYTVTINANGTGSVTLVVAATSSNNITIIGARDIERTTDFVTAGDLKASSLNEQLDALTIFDQQINERVDRAVISPVDDPQDIDMTLPSKSDRVGKYLAFNATTGQPEAGPSTSNVNSLAAITDDIATLADIEDGTDATDAIQTVAGIAGNVTTVAGIGATAMANVSGKATEIGRLGTADAVADMNTLGTAAIVSDMDTLADIVTDIQTLADIEDGTDATDAIQTCASNISDIQGASQAATDAASARDSAKAISAAMGAALDDFADRYLGTMADTATAPANVTPTITTTNGSADITVSSASGISIGMKVTSTNIPAGTNVIGISGTTISLDNSATAAASGTASTFSAHGVYGTFDSGTDGPSSDNDGDALVTGALYFNTTDNEMRVYDGANWIAASAAGSASMIIYEYTVSGSAQTTFSGADDNGLTLSYTTDNVIVVKDGVILHDDDYTSTNGTSIVLGSSAAVGSEIVIFAFKSFTVADTVSKSSGGTFTGAVGFSGGITGDVAFDTNTLFVDSTNNEVGIGTTSPTKKLSASIGLNDTDGLALEYSGENKGGILLHPAGGEVRMGALNSTGTYSTTIYSNGSERMRIDSSGNVGIGATTVDAKLHVEVSSGDANLKLEDASAVHMLIDQNSIGGSDVIRFKTGSSLTERYRVDNGGNHMFNKTAVGDNTAGVDIRTDGRTTICRPTGQPLNVSRTNDDGGMVEFIAQGTTEGTITVSGTTVSYNGGHLSRWSQLTDGTEDTTIVKGTVMTNLDQMAEWSYDEGVYTIDDVLPDGVSVGDVKPAYTEDNEQLNCMAVSSVEGDANVAGVFVNWDNDDDNFNDMNVAMTGDMVIRIAQGTTVARGDLLMSAGDGTAKPQGDDIVRSKTIAKVTSTNVSHTYDDGSYLVPCVLMAC